MKILHYFLGFPPYRTGGLTKYCFDLMKEQANQGDEVTALWPGQMNFLSKQTKMKRRRSVGTIKNYEIINPLPVALDEGISDFDVYMEPCPEAIYYNFLREVAPEAIHIHTLMGLHREFLQAAIRLKIRTVFTTHDYFGICPKVTLYRYGEVCENDHGCKDCIQCNCTALSINRIRLMQSPLYRFLKNSALVKTLRNQHRGYFYANERLPDMPVPDSEVPEAASEYKRLREYYIQMLSMCDLIYFNSTVTEAVYNRYFTPKASVVRTITHQNISDNRTAISWKPEGVLRLTCLAPAKPYKGYKVMKDVLDDLWNSGNKNIELKLFSPVENIAPYMKVQADGFKYDQLKSIMMDTDVLLAPSVWYETFGFTVLEAISYGVPVIVSDSVGAKDIIGNGGIVVEAGNRNSLREAIIALTPEKLRELRNNIQKSAKIKTWKQFVEENYELYR